MFNFRPANYGQAPRVGLGATGLGQDQTFYDVPIPQLTPAELGAGYIPADLAPIVSFTPSQPVSDIYNNTNYVLTNVWENYKYVVIAAGVLGLAFMFRKGR